MWLLCLLRLPPMGPRLALTQLPIFSPQPPTDAIYLSQLIIQPSPPFWFCFVSKRLSYSVAQIGYKLRHSTCLSLLGTEVTDASHHAQPHITLKGNLSSQPLQYLHGVPVSPCFRCGPEVPTSNLPFTLKF